MSFHYVFNLLYKRLFLSMIISLISEKFLFTVNIVEAGCTCLEYLK